jgi:hypothetical protein
MVARRKAAIAVGTLLAVAVVGTTFASAPGTVLRMGVTNTITGNYVTTLQGTVSSWVFQARNNSATSTSAAILAYSPFGGVPLDLRAKLGQPPMRVNSNVRVLNLNADRVDYYHASIPLAPNTIAVRDGANTINANVNGNASTATNAANANFAANSNLLDGQDSTAFAQANQLPLVRYVGAGTATVPATDSPPMYSFTFTAPRAGVIRVDTTLTLTGTGCPCRARAALYNATTSQYLTSYYTDSTVVADNQFAALAMTGAGNVAAGTQTIEVRVFRVGGTSLSAYGNFTGTWTAGSLAASSLSRAGVRDQAATPGR